MNADYVRKKFLRFIKLIQSLFQCDSKVVKQTEQWNRSEGGGGKTCAFSNGLYLEKGGINSSDVKDPNFLQLHWRTDLNLLNPPFEQWACL